MKPTAGPAPKAEKTGSETAPNYTVRTDPGAQKIDKFFGPNAPAPPSVTNANVTVSTETKYDRYNWPIFKRKLITHSD